MIELAGTKLKYNYRNEQLIIALDINRYAVSNQQFKIISKNKFGFFSNANKLFYFNQADSDPALEIHTAANLSIDIKKWTPGEVAFTQSSSGGVSNLVKYKVNHLKPSSDYSVSINGNLTNIKSSNKGSLVFKFKTNGNAAEILILNQ